MTSAISAAEALMGLLSFAIATGLFFGRFSKHEAFLKFSHNAIIGPYHDTTGLMIRLTPYKNTNFTDAEVKVTLGMNVAENGIMKNQFYTLDLEMDRINSLNLSWTLVHPITEESPLFGFDAANFANITGEIMVFIKIFDDMYSTVVTTRTSYTFKEVIYGAKFKPMFSRSTNNSKTILYLNMLNEFENVSFMNGIQEGKSI